jgi:hypothetical protein
MLSVLLIQLAMAAPDGAPCATLSWGGSMECDSGYCVAGPWGQGTCMNGASNCPNPHGAGAMYGDTYDWDGGSWLCEAGVGLVAQCAVDGCLGVTSGFLCDSDTDCASDHCAPGPGLDGISYCAEPGHCAQPTRYVTTGHLGALPGTSYDWEGSSWTCDGAGVLHHDGAHDTQGYGAQALGGPPIGGGPGYGRWVDPFHPDHHDVHSATDLVEALAAADAAPGRQVVYVHEGVDINLADLAAHGLPLHIGDGVTLASGRGQDGKRGALIRFDPDPLDPDVADIWFAGHTTTMLEISGAQARVTGLRLHGSDPHHRYMSHGRPMEQALMVRGPDATIDNNELRGWSNSAVHLEGEGVGSRVGYNFIHHNRRYGMGYGVSTYSLGIDRGAYPFIVGNLFDWNRHSIATAGQAFDFYRARGNIVGDNSTHYPFDVHEEDGGAGEAFLIEYNSFYTGNGLGEVHLQDTPRVQAIVVRNHFGMHDRATVAGPACPNPLVVSAIDLEVGDSCAVSQTYPEPRYAGLTHVEKRDNRHRSDATACESVACEEDWACGPGRCVGGVCACR